MQIVIAWAEKTRLVPTGRHIMRDMNWFPEFRADWEGKAAMWLSKGTEVDEQKARDYAKTDNRMVFTFPPNEKDPLGKARAKAVAFAQLTDKAA